MFGIQRLNAATNVLLAKHVLDHVELVPENPVARQLRDSIVTDLRNGTGKNVSDAVIELMFNGWDRIRQLLVIAESFNRLAITPMITPEVWCRVKNPFDPKMDSERHRQAVTQRIRMSYGITIHLDDTRMFLSEVGMFDEPLPTEPRISFLHTYLLPILQSSLSEPSKAHVVLQAPGGLSEAVKLVQQLMQASFLMYQSHARRFASYNGFSQAMSEGDEMFIAPSFRNGTIIGTDLRQWCIWLAWAAFRGGVGEAQTPEFLDQHLTRWRAASEPKLAELEKRFAE
jgi:hypothetical protein